MEIFICHQILYGPKVVQNIDVTRHIIKYLPEYIDKDARSVSAVSPGVLGTTGIETLEIIKGIVDNTKPKLAIVIDSLASKSIERISSTIQIADTRNYTRCWSRKRAKGVNKKDFRDTCYSNRNSNSCRKCCYC